MPRKHTPKDSNSDAFVDIKVTNADIYKLITEHNTKFDDYADKLQTHIEDDANVHKEMNTNWGNKLRLLKLTIGGVIAVGSAIIIFMATYLFSK